MADEILTQDLVCSIFNYENGILFRKGKPLQVSKGHKYIRVGLFGKKYYAHRIIYLMFNGELPEFIDHIDGNTLNNKIENLRAANKVQNGQNSKISKANKSGIKGVSWYKAYDKWAAECYVNGKRCHLGYFSDIEQAGFAVKSFREQNHGKFARHS